MTSSSAILTNVTFAGNSATSLGGAIRNLGSSSATLTNCIVWGDGSQLDAAADSPLSVSYSIVQGGWAGDDNLNADPQFVDAANGDLHLRRTSPAINSGSNTPVTVATDLDGNPRIKHDVVDRGAYEVQNLAPVIAVDNHSVVEEGQTADNAGTLSDPDLDVVTLTASAGTITNNSDGTWSWSFETTDGPAQTQVVTLTADDGHGVVTSTFDLTVNNVAPSVTAENATVKVDEAQSATNTGSVSDPGGDTVSLAASMGTIVDNGNGTWSWSFAASDGPDEGRVVTITATDSDGATTTTTFELVVNDVAPAASVSGPANGLAGQPLWFTFGATDVSPVDQNATFQYRIDWNGDGNVDETVSAPASTTVGHTFAEGGATAVLVTATDKDGGVSDQVRCEINVIQPVTVDVKPGTSQNTVNGKSQGVIPLAILTTHDFNATTVNANTVGLEGVAADHFAREDVDQDGDLDLILQFRTQAVLDALGLQLGSGQTERVLVELTGETVDDVMIQGFDMIEFFLPGKGTGKK